MAYKVTQNVEVIKKHYEQEAIKRQKYRGKIPKKKRIRNKKVKQKAHQKNKYIKVLDDFHLIGKSSSNYRDNLSWKEAEKPASFLCLYLKTLLLILQFFIFFTFAVKPITTCVWSVFYYTCKDKIQNIPHLHLTN